MKKIFIILLLVISPILVKAEETVEVTVVPVENVYWNYYKNGNYYSGQFAYIYVGDKIGYSFGDPSDLASETYKATREKPLQSRTEDFAYFSYGYEGLNTLYHYMASQYRMWHYGGSVTPYFTTGPNGTGKLIDLSKYDADLNSLYNSTFEFPEYEYNFTINKGTKKYISNKNLVSKDFNIINESTNNISIDENNNLTIEANQIGEYIFYLETNYPYNGENIIYKSDSGKKIIVGGHPQKHRKEYRYNVVGGSININVKFDKNTNNKITDNSFELYDSNEKLIGTYKPDEKGNIIISNLSVDKYKLKHINIPEGYNKEDNGYLLEISNENQNIYKEIILNLKTTKISINKTYGNIILNNINYDSNVVFEIYNETGEFINNVKTNEEGYVEFNLDYGNYKIIESNLKRKLDYIEINKTMFDNDNHFDIHTYEYNTNLKVVSLNKDTKEKISNVNFTFNDNDYITNEEGIYIIKNIAFDTYKFNEININGFKKTDSFTYEINRNSEFYIYNNEPYTEIKLYLEKEEIEKENENINNNDIEEKDEQELKDNEEIKEKENIFVEVEKNEIPVQEEDINEKNNDTSDIANNKVEIENNDLSYIEENIEKLPFLGDSKENEDTKVINYIYNFIKYVRL